MKEINSAGQPARRRKMKFYLHTNTLELSKGQLFKEDTDKLESIYDTLNHIPAGETFTPSDVANAYKALLVEIGKTNARYAGFYSFDEIVQDVGFCTGHSYLHPDTSIIKIAAYKYLRQ
jgi:hypothetical protein